MLRKSTSKASYSKPVDPTVSDLPHADNAEWQNSASGGWFDWDQYARKWILRADGSLSHARQHAINSSDDHTGYGDSVTKNVGTGASDVAAGNHGHAHNDTTALNTGDYQHLTAAQLATLPTVDDANLMIVAARKYLSGN